MTVCAYLKEESQRSGIVAVEDAAGRRLLLLQLLKDKLWDRRLEAAEKTPRVYVIGAKEAVGGGVSVRSTKKRWRQFLAALLATLLTMSGGSTMGWSAPALPLLEARLNNTCYPMTESQSSWVSSLLPLGALAGVLTAGYLANTAGRKCAMIVLVLPYLAGWILVAVDVLQLPLIYAGRFVCGVCLGAGSIVTPMYVEEIAEVSLRGVLGVLYDIMVGMGILWSYTMGATLSYWGLVTACATLPVVFAITFCWMPESPVYLVSTGRDDAAKKSLQWLRGSDNILAELQQLERDTGRRQDVVSLRPAVKAAGIVAGLMMFRQLSGVNAVLFYAVDIFHRAGSSLSPTMSAVVVGMAQVVATMVSGCLVEAVGRRVLLASSGVISALCHGALASYFYNRDDYGGSQEWLPLCALVVFMMAFNLGLGPLPWLISAELVPVGARGWASPLAVSVNWLLVFVVTLCFARVESLLGPTAVFGFFSLACVASVVFVVMFLPETRGKTREQIQDMLTTGRQARPHQEHETRVRPDNNHVQ